MKKLDNKGQVLIETLVTSVMIVGVLIYLFIQLRSVNANYTKTSHYNSINALYAADNYRTFIMGSEEHYSIKSNPEGSTQSYFLTHEATNNGYVDLTSCDASYGIVNTDYCKSLISDLKIKQVIMTKEDTSTITAAIDAGYINTVNIDANFQAFIKSQKTDKETDMYRIFVETTEDDFASIKLK